jgi:uncharacterized Ntn-hydrolase superfamily protein
MELENQSNQNKRSGDLQVDLNLDKIKDIKKQYKKIKKYMRSPLYEVQKMNGIETSVDKLIKKYNT